MTAVDLAGDGITDSRWYGQDANRQIGNRGGLIQPTLFGLFVFGTAVPLRRALVRRGR